MGIETPCTVLTYQPKDVKLGADGFLHTKSPPGTAWWVLWHGREEKAGLRFSCPCGCGTVGMFRIGTGHSKEPWRQLGDNDLAPTFVPSMQVFFPCKWHGYLDNGVFRKC